MKDLEKILYCMVIAAAVYYVYVEFLYKASSPTPVYEAMSTKVTEQVDNLAGAKDFTDNNVIPPEDGSFPAALLHDRRAEAPLQAQDLLPSDPNEAWSTINPEGRGSIAYKNFLEASHHFGVDTVGSSLRNANTQLRSDIPVPRHSVSPWMQSTITPDTNRRDLQIGTTV